MSPRPKSQRTAAVKHWLATWSAAQARHSHWPLKFWTALAAQLLAGRAQFDNNPLAPIGHYALATPGALEFLVARNNAGLEQEKKNNLDAAISTYELSIADAFLGTQPYDRLRIIYTRRAWYQDAIRICRAYLDLPNRAHGQNKPHFKQHLLKLQHKQARPAKSQ